MDRWSMMRGDDPPFSFTVSDDGTPIDLTGCELTWTAKRHYEDAQDADSTIVKTIGDGIEVVSAAAGTIIVTLDAADTADIESEWPAWVTGCTYVWDLEVLDDYEQKRTRGRGTLRVYRDVTVSTA
jgi:hypothetical protein